MRSFSHTEKTDSGYLYGDYFFLTDDPNMTFEKYQKAVSSPLNDHMQLLLPTELVIGKSALGEDEREWQANAAGCIYGSCTVAEEAAQCLLWTRFAQLWDIVL